MKKVIKKSEMVEEISYRLGYSKNIVEDVFREMDDIIIEAISENEEAEIKFSSLFKLKSKFSLNNLCNINKPTNRLKFSFGITSNQVTREMFKERYEDNLITK